MSGIFRETIVKDEILNSEDIHDNKYSSYFKYEFAYLSSCVSEVHIIDLRAEGTPNTSEYVKNMISMQF